MNKFFRIIKYGFKSFFVDIPDIVKSPSYFPELKRKSKIKRWFDNVAWFFKEKEPNVFYNLYGMDIKGRKQFKMGYLGELRFRATRNKMNKVRAVYNSLILLRDKFVFSNYFESVDIPVVHNIAFCLNGKIIKDKEETSLEELKKICPEDGIFIKVEDGECADGVWHVYVKDNNWVNSKGEIINVEEIISKHAMIIFQKKLIQHKDMSALNPTSVNTLRIVTCYTENGVEILKAGLRVGTTASSVDNWATGGVIVGINDEGKLKEFGFYKPCIASKKITVHPMSNITFKDYQIPYYKEAIELVKRAHEYCYGIFGIGWDVAITENGPVLIEGNDNFDTALMQIVGEGLKEPWMDKVKRHKKMKTRI